MGWVIWCEVGGYACEWCVCGGGGEGGGVVMTRGGMELICNTDFSSPRS